MKDIEKLRTKIFETDIEKSIEAIDEVVQLVGELSTLLLDRLYQSKERFIYADHISGLFLSFSNGLQNFLNDDNFDVRFWASSIVVHHNIKDSKAEKILLDAIVNSPLKYAYPATTILCRHRIASAKNLISQRLEDPTLTKEAKDFFLDHLNDWR